MAVIYMIFSNGNCDSILWLVLLFNSIQVQFKSFIACTNSVACNDQLMENSDGIHNQILSSIVICDSKQTDCAWIFK